jgi:hypothetical protein
MTTAVATLDTDIAASASPSGILATSFAAVRTLVMAFLILAGSLGAVFASPAQEAAASTGPGWHNHGSIGCGTNRYINVYGAQAQRNGTPGPGGSSTVYYRAIAYQWNGSSWSYSSATAWQVMYPYGTGTVTFKNTGFNVYTAGQFAVQTEFQWYDYRGAVYYGKSVGWASGGAICTYR